MLDFRVRSIDNIGVIPFDPADPFPLLPFGSHTYREAQEHSALVDTWLGLETERIEAELIESAAPVARDVQQLWIGLPIQALQTPYSELRLILNELDLNPGQTIVDLGAGYGRLAFVVGRHAKDIRFVGYELVRERVLEARARLHPFEFHNVEMIEADLASPDFVPVEADAYFLYDYGTRSAIEKTLRDLRAVSMRRPIVVVGRGRASRDAIERGEPWLSQVIPPMHYDHFSIYFS